MFRKKPLPADSAPPVDQVQAAPHGGQRRIVMILVLVLLGVLALAAGLLAAVGPAALRGLFGPAPALTDTAAPAQGEGVPPPPGADPVAMPFDEMIVNITAITESGRQTSRFLKVDLALVYDRTQDPQGLVAARHLFLRDAFQDYLRQLAERDLEGTLGLVTVKGELLRRARAISGSDAPYEILITGLVIQ
jgi:flagellar protein FliL